ncbi:MAG TPA: AMP-binding protein [Vicinamibacteria bacterium]|nr:AMP-binding protein [Vicinamibacteria bacterium]
MADTWGAATPPPNDVVEHVLDVVRQLARETGGSRAERAVSAQASLEREVGLGSLERVELMARLERAFARPLDDACLAVDTAAGLARAILEAAPGEPLRLPAREAALGAASAIGTGVRTLCDSLWRHAELDPERVHVFLRGEDEAGAEQEVSYGRLRDEAAAIAGGLRERGIGRGDTVALMLPTGLDFLRSFFGILLLRAVPVPIYPPLRLDRLEEYASRQSGILGDAGVALLVTIARARPVVSLFRPSVPTLRDVVTADELAAAGAAIAGPDGDASDPALVQYTSGSTGQPKGVLLTQANLLANIRAIAAGLEMEPTDVGVSWLPLYHDMGLIGAWLNCLHHGLPLTLLPPTAFLARPERWLWAIHERRATLSAAPNFAYELAARRIADERLEGLDLSSWRVALNGAEPVSPGTLERFARRFAAHGFRPGTMTPVYGLAECSVALAFPPIGRGPRVDRIAREPFQREGRERPAAPGDPAALEFVSAGRELPEHEIRIVDDAGNDVGERVVGRLVFRGPSMTSGYYRKPEATAAITLPGGWLDSGDLAYRADGEVHVCGRRKDLIIKAGRNLVPQEIEEAAAGVPGVRRGCVVAFGVENATLGTEALVIVAETRASDRLERERIVGAVTERVAAAVELPPDQVVLVAPGRVLKTSSGKVRRAATKEQFVKGALGAAQRTTLGQKARLVLAAALELARPWARRARRALYAAWLALVLPPLLLPAWALVALVPSRRFGFALARFTVRAGLRLVGIRLEASGLERLPRQGPLVLACNHGSYADIVALVALLPIDVLFVAKREVLGYPLVASFVRRCGHLTVDRWDAVQSVADADVVARALAAGSDVLFFPEGTFVAATGLRPFRLGAFMAAARASAPLVPLALRGTRHVLRGDWGLPRPGRLSLWVGDPIQPRGTDMAALVALRAEAMDRIAEHCGEPRLDLVAAGLARPASA